MRGVPLTHSLTHSLTHPPTHPPTHPVTHSPTHPPTHPPLPLSRMLCLAGCNLSLKETSGECWCTLTTGCQLHLFDCDLAGIMQHRNALFDGCPEESERNFRNTLKKSIMMLHDTCQIAMEQVKPTAVLSVCTNTSRLASSTISRASKKTPGSMLMCSSVKSAQRGWPPSQDTRHS